MKSYSILIFALSVTFSLKAQIDLSYYLPSGVNYNPDIPPPKSVIGHEVGEWHISHDKLAHYMEVVAQSSDRIQIETIGYSYEGRPLQILTITSPQNHQNIDKIKSEHQQLTDPVMSDQLDIGAMPSVIFIGYSVHGNEPSGSNASLIAAYYLAAAQGDEIEQLLNEVVILLHPSINPDGLHRFSTWVNSHKSFQQIADPNTREHNEAWPRGRTNHYWFDLNRDWLLVQHPESKARMREFHEWKPNILTDHHEMGSNSTFFFQPGIPSRNHPLTPQNTFTLTEKIAEYHAQYLDEIGSFYYTKESFDDFYYGKGSTFPDINGGVGILFEQASSRGHAQETENGILEFPFTIKNQFTTTLSTIKAGQELRIDLLNHMKDFYKSSLNFADNESVKAYVFGSSKDQGKTYHLAELLRRHQIDIYRPARDINYGGYSFKTAESYIVPVRQKQARLIKAIFEKRTQFQDSLFYDVSSWTMPLAFNLEYAELNDRAYNSNLLGGKVETPEFPQGEVIGGKSDYAYIFQWHEYYTPRALNTILENQLIAKVATEKFTSNDGVTFDYGTILVPVSTQKLSSDDIYTLMQKIAEDNGIKIHAVNSGLINNGIDLGSPSYEALRNPGIMMLVDGGVSGYESGEVWHLMDQRYKTKISLISVDDFNRTDIDKYNTLVLVNGSYSGISNRAMDKLKNWIREGGVVVATKRAGQWLSNNKITSVKYKQQERDSSVRRDYGDLNRFRGAQVIGGAIFNVNLDLTHPIAYGYYNERMSVFRNSTIFMERSSNPYANPVVYTSNPLASGYISDENEEILRNSAAISVSAMGSGRIITFSDNPNFRAFWYGTNKLFANSIFFGHIISGRSAR